MSQKNRNDLNSALGSNVYSNSNKEITATMLKSIINDIIDSKFNIVEDELENVKYNDTQTLEEYLNSIVGGIPLWGSTDYFDPSSDNGSIESYSENGIVSDIVYLRPSNERTEITINLSQSTSNRKIVISIHTEQSNVSGESNYTTPVIKRVSSTQVKIGLREIGGTVGKIRLEILAF